MEVSSLRDTIWRIACDNITVVACKQGTRGQNACPPSEADSGLHSGGVTRGQLLGQGDNQFKLGGIPRQNAFIGRVNPALASLRPDSFFVEPHGDATVRGSFCPSHRIPAMAFCSQGFTTR
jgi:hypothetical protein